MTKVSIIIPIYNVEKYITECLESLISQTLQDIEILCIDDCSTDNSIQIVKSFANKDSRIKLIQLNDNKGQGYARNLGIKTAKGDYIIFVDPDDYLTINACEIAYNQITENKNDFVIFNYNKVDEFGTFIKRGDYRIKPFKTVIKQPKIELNKLKTPFLKNMFSWAQIYNKTFLQENSIEYANIRIGEDVPFLTKAFVKAKDISIIEEPLYNYRIHNKSTSFNTSLYHSHIIARELGLKIIKEAQASSILRRSYIIYCIKTLLLWYKRYKKDKKIRAKFYKEIRSFFITLTKIDNIEEIKDEIDFQTFKIFLTYKNLLFYRVARELKKFLS